MLRDCRPEKDDSLQTLSPPESTLAVLAVSAVEISE
jgi:hypothetical protein